MSFSVQFVGVDGNWYRHATYLDSEKAIEVAQCKFLVKPYCVWRVKCDQSGSILWCGSETWGAK